MPRLLRFWILGCLLCVGLCFLLYPFFARARERARASQPIVGGKPVAPKLNMSDPKVRAWLKSERAKFPKSEFGKQLYNK